MMYVGILMETIVADIISDIGSGSQNTLFLLSCPITT